MLGFLVVLGLLVVRFVSYVCWVCKFVRSVRCASYIKSVRFVSYFRSVSFVRGASYSNCVRLVSCAVCFRCWFLLGAFRSLVALHVIGVSSNSMMGYHSWEMAIPIARTI